MNSQTPTVLFAWHISHILPETMRSFDDDEIASGQLFWMFDAQIERLMESIAVLILCK
jgi:hypothetical protein